MESIYPLQLWLKPKILKICWFSWRWLEVSNVAQLLRLAKC